MSSLGPQATNIAPAAWTYPALGIALGVGVTVEVCRSGLPPLTLPLALWLGFFSYGALTIAWGPVEFPWLSVGSVLLAVLVMLLPWIAMSSQAERALSAQQVLVASCGTVIAGSSIHAIGLTVLGLHVPFQDRLALPIGGASSSGAALVVCLAVLWESALHKKKVEMRLDGALVIAALLLIAQTGSRVAVLMAVGVLLVGVWRLSRGRRLTQVTVVIVSLLLVATLRATRGGISWADDARGRTFVRSVDMWRDSWVDIVFGAGVGEVWPWLAIETGRIPRLGESLEWASPYGGLLYHPHSLPLGVLVEMGLVGVLFLSFAVIGLVAGLISRGPGTPVLLVAALIMLVPALSLEYLLLRNFPASLLLWAFIWCGVAPDGSSARWSRSRPHDRYDHGVDRRAEGSAHGRDS